MPENGEPVILETVVYSYGKMLLKAERKFFEHEVRRSKQNLVETLTGRAPKGIKELFIIHIAHKLFFRPLQLSFR
jgi:hypothetical protein